MCVETPENGVKAPSESFLVGPSIADEFGDELALSDLIECSRALFYQ